MRHVIRLFSGKREKNVEREQSERETFLANRWTSRYTKRERERKWEETLPVRLYINQFPSTLHSSNQEWTVRKHSAFPHASKLSHDYLASRSPVSKEEKTSNGHHLSESSQSAFRRISAVKTEPTDMTHGKTSKNGTVHSTEALLSNKTSIPNPFLPPLLSSPSDFHSHLALLRPFLSQTLPFVPSLSPSTYWNAFPFLHPYLSNLRPPTFLPPTLSLSSLPSSSPPPPPPPPPPPSSSAPKASTSSNANAKKPSAATHYHQYTITNNNVLVPSPATLIDFIRRPTNSARETSSTSTNANPTKSKNLKKYKCDICSRAFSRSNTLVTHKVNYSLVQ